MSQPRPMDYRVSHLTTYRYPGPVTISHHAARLRPRTFAGQTVHEARLEISPAPVHRRDRLDFFGNHLTTFTLVEPYHSLCALAEARVSVRPPALPEAGQTPPWETVTARLAGGVGAEIVENVQYSFDSPLIAASPALKAFAEASFPKGRPVLAGALDLCRRIHGEFTYDPTATTVATPTDQVLAERRGVCQDFAHLMIGALRSLGLAARYVSGYVLTRMPGDSARLAGGDASHAWISLFVPMAEAPHGGWIDIDPTNNKLVTHEHVVTAWGRDFEDVSPIKGVMLGGGAALPEVAVTVTPLDSRGNPLTGDG